MKNFTYSADGKLDSYHILPEEGGEGDCDDFAITVLFNEAGRNHWRLFKNFVTGRSKMVRVFTNTGGTHMVAQHDDRYMDNWYPYWSTELRHKRRYAWPWPVIYLKLFIGLFVKH